MTIRDANHNNSLDWTHGYARYDRRCPDAMYRMREEEYVPIRELAQFILSSAKNLRSVEIMDTDVPLTEALVTDINAHPHLYSITLANFRQLNSLPATFCSSTPLSRIHFHGLQLLERALDVPLRPGLLQACARKEDGPHIHELINDYFSNFPARDLTFNGLQRLKLDYPDQLATSMTTDFFVRHEHLRSVFLGISVVKYPNTIMTTLGCGLRKMYDAALGEHLENTFMLIDTQFSVDPMLDRGDAASWRIKSAGVVLNAEHRRALGHVLEHMPLCEDMAIHDRAEETKMSAVSLRGLYRMLQLCSDPLFQSELWATLMEQSDKLKHLRALTLWEFSLLDDITSGSPDVKASIALFKSEKALAAFGEKLKGKVEEVARRCGNLEYVAVIVPISGYYLEFRIFTRERKGVDELEGVREVRVELEITRWTGERKEALRRRQCLNGEL